MLTDAAEWAIKALQAEGARHREADSPVQPVVKSQIHDPLGYRGPPVVAGQPIPIEEPKHEPVRDYGSYECKAGRLILNSIGVRYETSIGHKEQWSLRYEDIHRLEKVA